MPVSGRRPPSHLKIAWTLLMGGVVALMLAAVLLPERDAPSGAEVARLELPTVPDGFAPVPDFASEAPNDAPELMAAPAPPARLPRVVRGEAEGEVEAARTQATDPLPVAPQPAARTRPPGAADASLARVGAYGPKPARAQDGRTPFAAYRRGGAVSEGPSVAVIVSGLGLDDALMTRALALPADVSLGFAPYAREVAAKMDRAQAAGHEAMIELPMEAPGVAADALGPAALLLSREPQANDQRLDWLLSRAPAYAMATSYLGGRFSRDRVAMDRVMAQLAEAGLAYVDDTSLAREAARAAGVPYAATDVVLSAVEGDVASQLRAVSARLAPGRVVLVKLYASPAALAALQGWLADLPEGAALVPASAAIGPS